MLGGPEHKGEDRMDVVNQEYILSAQKGGPYTRQQCRHMHALGSQSPLNSP